MMQQDDLNYGWLRWWSHAFLQQVDSSWHHLLPWFQLTSRQQQQLLTFTPQALPELLLIPATLPPAPDQRLLRWVALSTAQQHAVFRLVTEICQPLNRGLTHEDLTWCSRLSRALHPGIWLPAQHDLYQAGQQLCLLQPLFDPACWQRLRLRFPAEQVTESERITHRYPPLPVKRLQALWDAVLWRIQQEHL